MVDVDAIGQTILQQIGGRRFQIMTGANRFVIHADGLAFRLPSTPDYVKHQINYVRIRLTPRDTYDVEYSRIWGARCRPIQTDTDVYADNLRQAFTAATGLDTNMGWVR